MLQNDPCASRSGWLFSGLTILLLAGCVAGPTADVTGRAAAPAPHAQALAPEIALEYHILVGELAVQRGDRAVAAREYVAALAYSDDPELAQRATRVALFAGEPELAFQAARAWTAADPNSADAQKTAARLALRNGDAQALAIHAEGVINQHSSSIAAGFKELAQVLSGEPEHADIALQVMQARVAAHADVPEAYYAQGLLALRYERLDLADQSIQQALAIQPDWDDAALLRAGILVRQGQIDEASELVASLEGSQAQRAEYHLSYARLLLDAEHTAQAADEFDRVLTLQPENSDARYGLGLLALSLGQPERAQEAFVALYESDQRSDDAAYYLGNIAAARDDHEQAQSWYERVESGSHAFDARVLAARSLYKQGDLAAAREALKQLRRANPELADRLYMSEAEILFDARDYQTALELYNQALESSPYDSDLLYGRSLVYERLGQIEQAKADLAAILEREPDDARALNALGYMLTNHGQDYARALEYIEQALQARPDDPAVIDSMGWVQYRLGNLHAARQYLEKAYALFPDPEVAAHLGEVLWQLGEQEKAQAIWQEALAEDPQSPVLRETMQRLNP